MSDFEGFIEALLKANVANILVIAGIGFLFIGLVLKVGAVIQVKPPQRKWAFIIGGVLLVAGIGLDVLQAPRTEGSEVAKGAPSSDPSHATSIQGSSPTQTPSPTQTLMSKLTKCPHALGRTSMI